MSQERAGRPAAVCWAAALCPGVTPGRRLPRMVQSDAAACLLEGVRGRSGIVAGPSSKAHARAMFAAAVTARGAVGIDVEYCAVGRPIRDIVRFLIGADIADAREGYRAFTFWEAYYKAFGEGPTRALVLDFVAADEDVARLGPEISASSLEPAPDFVLTLVWRGTGAPERLSL